MSQPDRLGRIALGIDRAILWLAAIPLVLMMLHISFDVVSNLVFGEPVPLTNAIVTQYYMIAVAYLPLAATELRRGHISVDLVVNALPGAPRHWIDMFTQVVSIAVSAALAMQAWQLALEKLGRDAFLMEQTSRVMTWPSYFIIPLGFGLMALLMSVRLVCQVAGRPLPESAVGPMTEASHV